MHRISNSSSRSHRRSRCFSRQMETGIILLIINNNNSSSSSTAREWMWVDTKRSFHGPSHLPLSLLVFSVPSRIFEAARRNAIAAWIDVTERQSNSFAWGWTASSEKSREWPAEMIALFISLVLFYQYFSHCFLFCSLLLCIWRNLFVFFSFLEFK